MIFLYLPLQEKESAASPELMSAVRLHRPVHMVPERKATGSKQRTQEQWSGPAPLFITLSNEMMCLQRFFFVFKGAVWNNFG